MNIHLATHHGMCFGVRDALRITHDAARSGPLTILGQLVHNPVVEAHFRTLGVQQASLTDVHSAQTQQVVITAHGAAETQRRQWREAGHTLTDTTCPLVRKAHHALETLVNSGCHPVIIGQATHVEVLGLRGDFPQAHVVLDDESITSLPYHAQFGVISQTTQPLEKVLRLVEQIKHQHPRSAVRFIDTVCRPTKQRQQALEELCANCELIIVIGGHNSNNTRQLVATAGKLGAVAIQIERAEDLQPAWFRHITNVGVTAGTSTLDETVRAVMDRLQAIAVDKNHTSLLSKFLPA